MQASNDKSMAIADPKPQGPDRKAGRKARIPLSCGPCRYRKLKCNRQQPCQNCIVRKEPAACIFMGSENTSTAPSLISHAHVENMQHRIDRLEELVKSLASQKKDENNRGSRPSLNESPAHGSIFQTPSAGAAEIAAPEKLKKGQGMMKVDDDHSVYVGSTHWSDVLHELNELKTSWSQVQEEQDALTLSTSFTSVTLDGPSLLYGLIKPVGVSELLATIPAKPAVDKLLARFFDEHNSPAPSLYVLHNPTFLKQYEDHWKCPSETKLMWLGLLFSILSITMLSYGQSKDEPPEYEGISQSLSELYHLRTTQCMMMADITKCLPHTIETLIYYGLAEGVSKKVSPAGVWIMGGLLIRVALQMGYHRDPSHFPNVSIFQGEMRRRIWYVLLTTEAVSSFIVGLPSMIQAIDHDAAEPRNIHDWELYAGMTELPPSRPASEETTVSYLIAKARLLRPLGAVVDFVSSLQPDSYDVALKIDEQLSRAHLQIPPYLMMRDSESGASAPSSVVNRRVQLEFLFHQAVCVLHRRFLVQGRLDSRFAQSRKQCIRSAMALLNHQVIMYESAKKTGSVTATYWFRVSPISQDFVLPAVILCLDLRHWKKELAEGGDPSLWSGDVQPKAMLEALEVAYKIWREVKDVSPETWKVYQVLCRLLERLGAVDETDGSSSTSQKAAPPTSSTPRQDFAIHNSDSSLDRNNGIPFTEMDIDWVAWDSFIEGSSFEDAYGAMQFGGDGFSGVGADNLFHEE